MPAFNHGPYIAQALDSVIEQQVDFRLEVVVGEDCSSDDTRSVALEYARRYPGIVRVLLHDRNLGMFDNDQRILQACRGTYVAWLESDDYWTSPTKLRRQAELLDRHPGYSACFHRAACVGGPPPATWRPGPPTSKPSYTIDDLLADGPFIPSCTMMFRAGLVRQPAEWTRETLFLERTYAARLALAGPIAFIDEELGAFRSHGTGIYGRSSVEEQHQGLIASHRLIGTHLELTDRPSYHAGLARMRRLVRR
jgi:glycosyltransferase involved in cell wall biosynthesis